MMSNALEIYANTPLEIAAAYAFDTCETKFDPIGPIHHQDVIMALIVTEGNKAQAARLVGRSRSALVRWIDKNLDVQEMLLDMQDSDIDDVESTTMKMAKMGDGASARFVLQTLGRRRGYVSRTEVTPINKQPIRTINEEMTDREAAEAYANTLSGNT